MAYVAKYLAHKSALARVGHPRVIGKLGPLMEEGLVATCAIVDLEVLFSARSRRDYEAIRQERLAFEDVPIDPDVLGVALDTQRRLARHGKHRLAINDLMIAATAQRAGLVVLHYDEDFERIAAVTHQKHEWVAPRGTV
jgi:predicted nucleic acid-binding protein